MKFKTAFFILAIFFMSLATIGSTSALPNRFDDVVVRGFLNVTNDTFILKDSSFLNCGKLYTVGNTVTCGTDGGSGSGSNFFQVSGNFISPNESVTSTGALNASNYTVTGRGVNITSNTVWASTLKITNIFIAGNDIATQFSKYNNENATTQILSQLAINLSNGNILSKSYVDSNDSSQQSQINTN